jgi:geranylgeranyl pyrophosphate synthase
MSFDLDAYLTQLRERIDRSLADRLPASAPKDPLRLREAMSAALLEGGKRLRPCLTLSACQAVGGELEHAIPAACAVEMVHAYSLVHDDLPAMDNDELRRGKPTSHKRFGESAALLVGDALLTLAFEVLGDQDPPGRAAPGEAQPALERCAARCRAVRELALAAGARGMVGGQALDMELKQLAAGAPGKPTFEELELCHSGKAAALFSASTAIGGIVGGGDDRQVEHLRSYGFDYGLAFQHADDLQDRSFPAHHERARERGVSLARRAATTAHRFGERGTALRALAEQLVERIGATAPPAAG